MFPKAKDGPPSNVEATDSETVASLLDPSYGIPPDIHFEIEDLEGTSLGILGGHKNILALRSPVFKAMLYGPMKETGDQIRIKDSSMLAFETMLKYIHDAEKEWEDGELELKEVFHITDLAERYKLPGLKQKTLDYALNFHFPREKLLEIAALAEQFHMHTDLSEALLENCAYFLTAVLETTEDYNRFIRKLSKEKEKDVALRLLARVDIAQMAFVGHTPGLPQRQEVISHLRNIDIGVQPRHRMQKLKAIMEEDRVNILDCIDEAQVANRNKKNEDFFIRSLIRCQKMDGKKAALAGVPLKLDTLVEDHFTHEASVRLHLDMTCESHSDWASRQSSKVAKDKGFVTDIWGAMLNSITEVKSIFLYWFADNPEMFEKSGQNCLSDLLLSCDDAIKQMPGYDKACNAYGEMTLKTSMN